MQRLSSAIPARASPPMRSTIFSNLSIPKKVMGRSGTGLGLAVVWNTMRDHGGMVTVMSDGTAPPSNSSFLVVDERSRRQQRHGLANFKGNGEQFSSSTTNPGSVR